MARGKFAQRRMKGTTMTVAVANKGRKGEEGTPLSLVHGPDGRREGRGAGTTRGLPAHWVNCFCSLWR